MKLIFVTECFPSLSAKIAQEVAERLKKSCKITVLASDILIEKMSKVIKEEEYINGIKVIRFKAFLTNISYTPYIFYSPLVFRRLEKVIDHEVDDNSIVHLHSTYGLLNLLTALCKNLRKRSTAMIWTSQGIPSGYFSFTLGIAARLLMKSVKSMTIDHCRFITTVGSRDRDFWVSKGVPKDIVRCIPNGVDTKVFKPCEYLQNQHRKALGFDDDDIVVMFLAQFRQAKGINVLLEAIPKVISHNSRVKFLLAGGGPLVDIVKSHVLKYQLEDHVIMTYEYVLHNDLPAFFNACDIYVLPSFVEGLPLSLMEAMACGKAVVATPVGNILDIVENGVNGFLVATGDADSLAKKIMTLVRSPELRDLMGKRNATKMKNYDWDVIADMYYSIYKEALISRRIY